MEVVKKRCSCPLMVQYFWDAIEATCHSKNCPTFDRLAAFIRKKHDVKEIELKRQLDYAVRDELVRYVERVSHKGPNSGDTRESYRMPDDDKAPGNHDWYCFECHRSGEVACCSTCHRVYHLFCLKEDVDPLEPFICAVCKMCKSPTFNLNNEELNRMLVFTCDRLYEKVTGDVNYPCLSRRPGLPSIDTGDSGSVSPDPFSDKASKEKRRLSQAEEECWRQSHLIYNYVDLVIMESKARSNKYGSLEEFQADTMTMVHNVVIFCGVHSLLADLARAMLVDCIYDLGEIRQCKDCYRMSNEKSDQYWFCQPCSPPHELVYAKQKGFPYWPAKVIRVQNDIYDVRFFGGFHQRADIDKKNIRDIHVNLNSLNIKKSMPWSKACEELKHHQMLLGRHISDTEVIPKVKRKKKPGRKPEPKPKREKWQEPVAVMDDTEAASRLEEMECEGETSQNDSSISSTTKMVNPSADDYNVVSSSCQESTSLSSQNVHASTQTTRLVISKNKHTQVCMGLMAAATTKEDLEQLRCKLNIQHQLAKTKAVKEATLKLQKQHELEVDRVTAATKASFQAELEKARQQTEAKCKTDHFRELEEANERHRCQLSEVKKKQWCYHCGVEAIYHCCWNTAYCSVDCQQSHWQKEHKRSCRRKR